MLTLRHAAELALERAPQLDRDARGARRGQRFRERSAADALHPSVWISTTPGYSTGLPVSVAGSVPAYGAIEVRQTIYDPWRKNEALQAEARAADLEGVVESGLRRDGRATAVARVRAEPGPTNGGPTRPGGGLAAAEAALRPSAARSSAQGAMTEIDVERAKLAAARAKQKLLNAESDRDLDGLELKRLIGWPGTAPLRLSSETESALRDEVGPTIWRRRARRTRS